jgi:hypothetical protein
MSTDPLNPSAVSPATPLVASAAQANPPAPTVAAPVTPEPANIPVSPLPPQSPSDAVSGVMLSQLGQLPVDPAAQQVPLATPTIAIPSPAGKEGLSVGLPAPTEIPLTTLKPSAIEGGVAPTASPEVGAATGGAVEQAPARELEPEVEATQEKIQQREINAPQETVIAAPTMPVAPPKTVSQPVVVLPLSEQAMQEGRKKSPQYSVRWLYVWCVRQIRKFSETLVVYRDK